MKESIHQIIMIVLNVYSQKSVAAKILEVKTESCKRIISIESQAFLYSILVLIEKVEKH